MPLIISPERCNLPFDAPLIFLAGSIEMGKAEDWQATLAEAILSVNPSVVVANPRRRVWDSGWKQSISNPVFREQVDWELDHLERADLAVFYFQPETISPITLMELGVRLAGPKHRETIVCCPEGFWRRGNVEVISARAGIEPPLLSLDTLSDKVLNWISKR